VLHGLREALDFLLDDFTSPVMSTFWADDMRAFHGTAVVALDECNGA
jgi:hypothetical protein